MESLIVDSCIYIGLLGPTLVTAFVMTVFYPASNSMTDLADKRSVGNIVDVRL